MLYVLDNLPPVLDIGKNGESVKEWHERIKKEISMNISQEILNKILKGMQEYLLELPEEILNKILKELQNKISDEVLKKMMEIPKGTYDKINGILLDLCCIRLSTFETLFEHFLHRDIYEEKASPKAKKFMYMKKTDPDRFYKEMEKKPDFLSRA